MYAVYGAAISVGCDGSNIQPLHLRSVQRTCYFVYRYRMPLRDQDLGAGFLVASLLFRDNICRTLLHLQRYLGAKLRR
jgi:hypothetical protein